MKLAYRSFYALCLVLLAGCTQLGLTSPQTFEERVAVGYTTITATRNTAATLLKANRISVDDAQNVANVTDNARAGLEIARKLGSAGGGDSKLAQVLTGLNAVQSYLESRK